MLANVDITAMAIPDFVAGFVYGMTGDNNLDEIQKCFQGGELVAEEVEIGISDIKKGGVDNDIQAGIQFAMAVTQMPAALKTCENMDENIAVIEDWASVFENPKELAKKLAMHYAMHHAKIQDDIKTLETDWDSQDYFKAGQDLADISVLALGPIQTGNGFGDNIPCPDNWNLTTEQIALLVSGFMYVYTGHDD